LGDSGALRADKLAEERDEGSDDESTPTTTESECSEALRYDDWESEAQEGEAPEVCEALPDQVPQLGPGLFSEGGAGDEPSAPTATAAATSATRPSEERRAEAVYVPGETLLVFDWDDTILPSSWIQRRGLRLDDASVASESEQERLAELATAAFATLRQAQRLGTVVIVTNAERGWLELSCQKFLPALLPAIEGIRIVSARTAYEGPDCASPLSWKVRAFAAEIARACGGAAGLADPAKRKNVHSLGDSTHEREALIRATARLPNCSSKSVKFVDCPSIDQLLKQHSLVGQCFEQIVQEVGDLDLSIDCS